MDSPFANQDYLRVLSPKTVDGNTLVTENINGSIVVSYKESHLPVTALKHLQERNAKLPEHLKMKIDVIRHVPAPPPPQPKPVSQNTNPANDDDDEEEDNENTTAPVATVNKTVANTTTAAKVQQPKPATNAAR